MALIFGGFWEIGFFFFGVRFFGCCFCCDGWVLVLVVFLAPCCVCGGVWYFIARG